jgi:phage host-nuclease inhibitor protein Gam
MARPKAKTAGANLPVPQSDAEAREAVRTLGDLNREVLRLEAEMNDQIAALQQSYGDRAAPLRDRAQATVEGLRIFAEANRDRLTAGGKVKFHLFSTGKISWRLKPAKVVIKGADTVIAAIRAMGLAPRFLREKVDINKEAMLEDRAAAAAIKGVQIGSDGEDFVVEPFETELGEAK